jgi:hypothetical protein
MARQYSHTQFFRQTPNGLLARYFQQHHQVIKELAFDKLKEAGSRYFCERFFRASCSKNQQKTTRPPMPSAAPIRPRHLVSTQQGVET